MLTLSSPTCSVRNRCGSRIPPKRRIAAALCISSCGSLAGADVSMPAVFSDHMVLQRDTTVAVWGLSRPGEAVRVEASWGAKAEAAGDGNGAWRVMIDTPGAGGPHTLTVTGDNTLRFNDVLIGEVWLCTGQSNMEWPLSQCEGGDDASRAAPIDGIRVFDVPNDITLHPRASAGDGWSALTPERAASFSGVAYFFARDLHEAAGVPVGIITADYGGTRIEAWMSDAMLEPIQSERDEMDLVRRLRDPQQRAALTEQGEGAWWNALDEPSPGAAWREPGFNDADWSGMDLPQTLGPDGLDRFDGVVRYRRVVELPQAWAGAAAQLSLGPIDDYDDAWVNGVHVGSVHQDGRWGQPRVYTVPAGVLKAGANVIAIRMLDTAGKGGVNGEPAQLALVGEDGSRVELAGAWKYQRGPEAASLPPRGQPVTVNRNTHTAMHSAMLAPVIPYGVRGIAWYQGESNTHQPREYMQLLRAFVGGLRAEMGRPEMPFAIIQIAPFEYARVYQARSAYEVDDRVGVVRDAQALTAASLPGVGLIVTADAGDREDIHPRDKRTVGARLARFARAAAGAPEVAWRSPERMGVEFADGAATVLFNNGEGLVARDGPAREFFVAGADKRFFPAQARIEGDRVIVRSEHVPQPVAVRYAWSDWCAPNLFNQAGLPAIPFRTDEWAVGEWSQDQRQEMDSYRTKDEGFVPLFNGADLSGWVNVNGAPSTWRAAVDETGEPIIACSGVPTGVMRTTEMYQNFILELEWRHHVPGGNAGLFVWSDALPVRGVPFTRSVEVQVMDGLEGDGYTSDGDIFPIHGARMTPENARGGDRAFPTQRRANRSPLWNHYRVECIDGSLSLWVNGEVVTRGRECSPRMGYICLESEGTPIDFRNIRVKRLPDTQPPLEPEFVARAQDGFTPLYNGVDFEGWKFTPEHEGHWTANDWVLSFDGGGTNLWTEKSYRDFVLIADWRWTAPAAPTARPVIEPDGDVQRDAQGNDVMRTVPDAGDSGIYLRGSSKAQVNMWCWPIGSGEVYGYRSDPAMPAGVRAACTPREVADSPIGQWNRFEITMKGSRLTVVLNGKTVIENAELPDVPAEGPIGLQMHGSPVEFANIHVKPLN